MLLYWLWLIQVNTLSKRQKLAVLQHFADVEALYRCKDYQNIPDLTPEQVASLQDKDLYSFRSQRYLFLVILPLLYHLCQDWALSKDREYRCSPP
jgi:hypothetical protein